jgi:LysR family glycine cleavage system transcriptional activator
MDKPSRLPPLGMLRIFEAAARLQSFTAAARELNVTHSAVSHQIRALEDQLGFPVFHREGRGVQLTVLGQEFAAQVNQALCDMGRSLTQLLQRANPNLLTVTCLPSFAACWLVPRIGRFLASHPQAEFNLISTSAMLDFARDGIDIAIRFGFGSYPAQNAELLMRDEMLVVASPALVGDEPPLKPEDLAKWPLLRSDGEFWRAWFERAGLDWPEPQGGLFINDSSLALHSARAGHGIALSRRSLCQIELDAGRLVQLFPLTLPNSRAYWFVTPAGIEHSPLAQDFHDWLYAEAAKAPPISSDPPVSDADLEQGIHSWGRLLHVQTHVNVDA